MLSVVIHMHSVGEEAKWYVDWYAHSGRGGQVLCCLCKIRHATQGIVVRDRLTQVCDIYLEMDKETGLLWERKDTMLCSLSIV